MDAHRRSFLKKNAFLTGSLLLAGTVDSVAGIVKSVNTRAAASKEIHIFHTNDLHGEAGNCFQEYGGLAAVQKSVNNHEINALMLDAGGFLNTSLSLQENRRFISLMNKTGYQVVTLGDEDLAGGEEYLESLLADMDFQIVNCNYRFTHPVLRKRVQPYQVLTYGQYRVGVTGVGPEVKGVQFTHPYEALQEISKHLKNELRCDLVVCLSHLGFEKDTAFNNIHLAERSADVDFVIGAHALNNPHGIRVVKNMKGKDVFVSHSLPKGLLLNKMVFAFNREQENTGVETHNSIPGLDSYKNNSKALASIQANLLHQEKQVRV